MKRQLEILTRHVCIHVCVHACHIERSTTNEIVGMAARTMIIEFTGAGSVIENETRQPSKIAFRPNDGPGAAQSVIRRCMLKLEYCIRAYAHFQSPPSTFDGHKFNNTADVNRTVASLLIDDSDEERGRRCLAKNHSLPPSLSLSLSLSPSLSASRDQENFLGGNGAGSSERNFLTGAESRFAIPCHSDSRNRERKEERKGK